MRVMAIDYGDARTGIAVSDAAGRLAGYTTVIQSRQPERVAEEIAKLARERQADELVMGFPRNMDGTEGPGRTCTATLPRWWRKRPGCPSACGTSAAPPLRPIRSSTPRGRG